MNGAMDRTSAAMEQVGSDIVFQVSGLTKVYEMGEVKVQALRGIDLELCSGELIVLLGPSGSGKSTLLKILGGLDTATSGGVTYCGKDLTSATEQELTEYRRYHIGFVFQFYNLIPSLTARENVAVVTEIARDPMTPEDALALVGLSERLDHFPSQLSGGEQQRIAIARAMESDLFRIPMVIERVTYSLAATVVVLSATISGLIVRNHLDHLDMIAVLKTRD